MGGAALNINHQETITINRQTNVQIGNQARYPRYLPSIIQQQYNPIIGATQQDGNTIFYRCTFEAFPGQYYLQETYECINCWGLGSAFRVCLICANNCHKGHQLIPCQSQNQTKVICDCGRLQHQTELCTSQSTSLLYVKQSVYKCIDCFDQETDIQSGNYVGVCISCSKKCHKGHRIVYSGFSDQFRCCCGIQQCRKKCEAKRN